MGDSSRIEWTEATWNCIYGCSRVSPGCENCYAERHCHRFSGAGERHEGLTVLRKKGPVWTGKIDLAYHRMFIPMQWSRARRIFVNSLSDVFHDGVPFGYVMAMFAVMAACPDHTFQLLTKRQRRMADFYAYMRKKESPARECVREAMSVLDTLYREEKLSAGIYERYSARLDAVPAKPWPLSNVWLGVSVEDQPRADERLEALFECEAAVHWASLEPLLGRVDLKNVKRRSGETFNALKQLDWAVIGGESGIGARSMELGWALDSLEQCESEGVPALMKQLGSKPTWADPSWKGEADEAPRVRVHLGDKKGGDWDEWPDPKLRVRNYPKLSSATEAALA